MLILLLPMFEPMFEPVVDPVLLPMLPVFPVVAVLVIVVLVVVVRFTLVELVLAAGSQANAKAATAKIPERANVFFIFRIISCFSF